MVGTSFLAYQSIMSQSKTLTENVLLATYVRKGYTCSTSFIRIWDRDLLITLDGYF